MKYLLDTDHISILQLRTSSENAILSVRIARHSPVDIAFSMVSFHEQVLGAQAFIGRARNSGDVVRGYRLLGEILTGFSSAPVIPFDVSAAAAFEGFRSQRIRVGTMDPRIVAIAINRGLTLLTQNVSDFSKVPGLVTEDWTA